MPGMQTDLYDETLHYCLDDGAELVYERRKLDGDPAAIPRHGLILETRA